MAKPIILNQSEIELLPEDLASLFTSAGESEQGTEEWHEEKLGKVSASRISDVVKRDRYGKPYKDYYDYMLELVIERVTGKRKRFSSKYMTHGTINEDFVAAIYEEMYPERDVRTTGFIEHPTLAAGASPDRLVDEDGLIEIKAPNTDTMIKYMISMLSEDDPNYELVKMLGLRGDEWKYYFDQIQWQLFITDRKWCDFVVGDPDMTENVQVIIKRIDRDDAYINETMVPRVEELLDKVAKLENYVRNYGEQDGR